MPGPRDGPLTDRTTEPAPSLFPQTRHVGDGGIIQRLGAESRRRANLAERPEPRPPPGTTPGDAGRQFKTPQPEPAGFKSTRPQLQNRKVLHHVELQLQPGPGPGLYPRTQPGTAGRRARQHPGDLRFPGWAPPLGGGPALDAPAQSARSPRRPARAGRVPVLPGGRRTQPGRSRPANWRHISPTLSKRSKLQFRTVEPAGPENQYREIIMKKEESGTRRGTNRNRNAGPNWTSAGTWSVNSSRCW